MYVLLEVDKSICDIMYGVATVSRIEKIIGLSFVEFRLFYWALLQKRPIILSILLTKATQYHDLCIFVLVQRAFVMGTVPPHRGLGFRVLGLRFRV